MMEQTNLANSEGGRLTRALVQQAGVRGVHVRLDGAWRQVHDRMEDARIQAPTALDLLGEAVAAAALFTGHAKVDGRLSIQLRSSGALRTIFAECTAAGTIRGIVQLSEDGGPVPRDLRELGRDAVLAITIENPALGRREPTRYQGLVELTSPSLSEALEDYFRQSEQLPTRLLLAADDQRATGLMLQKLPGDDGDEDGWTRVGALFETLSESELLASPAQALLHRLFHEDGVQILGDKALAFACSCSRARVESMLMSLGEHEALAAAAEGQAEIRCEFCGECYRFSRDEIQRQLTIGSSEMGAPEGLQ